MNPVSPAVRHRVIFDTDPGVDDAMALYYALAHPAIEVVGMTTTFGNVLVQQATENALYLAHLAGRSIPVAQGAAQALVKGFEHPPAHIHGGDGLGNLHTRHQHPTLADPRSAPQFIVDMARAYPGEITLVPVGPLGNIAQALALEPRLPRLIKRVVLMGGSIDEPGNVSPVAEANIWHDPHAADRVMTAGFDLTMVGLDVTHRLVLPLGLFEKIAQHQRHPATDALLQAVRFYADFYTQRFSHSMTQTGCFGHDVMAFLYLTNPELFGLEHGPIRVVTDGITQGQTVMKRQGHWRYPQAGWDDGVPGAAACLRVQADSAGAVFEATLLRPWLART